jgi:Lon-like protease
MRFQLKTKKITVIVIVAILCIGIGVYLLLPIPYYVMQPGLALDVKPFVQVGNEEPQEKGSFLLTTISLKEGAMFDYIATKLSQEMELVPRTQILAPDETDEEYQRRQMENMMQSQNYALIAAFRQAQKPVTVQTLGVEVFQILPNASKALQINDLIQAIDHIPTPSSTKLITYLQSKKPGDVVTVQLLRANQQMEKEVTLIGLPEESSAAPKRAGLGVIPLTRMSVKTTPPAKIEAGDIGGPSAGLMFSLEVFNRLTSEDLTRGLTIAGTGTIDEQGKVGQIGGIQYKIMAAHAKQAQIFFCPKDMDPDDENEKVAKATVQKINTPLKVVPVSTLDEAVQYLRNLKVDTLPTSLKSHVWTEVAA